MEEHGLEAVSTESFCNILTGTRRTAGCKCLLQATRNSAQQNLALERRKYTKK